FGLAERHAVRVSGPAWRRQPPCEAWVAYRMNTVSPVSYGLPGIYQQAIAVHDVLAGDRHQHFIRTSRSDHGLVPLADDSDDTLCDGGGRDEASVRRFGAGHDRSGSTRLEMRKSRRYVTGLRETTFLISGARATSVDYCPSLIPLFPLAA